MDLNLNIFIKKIRIAIEIAYLGSLNFTYNGTRNNYETRIRIADRKAIKELNAEFDALFYNENYLEKELSEWGRELYVEPVKLRGYYI
ncbi:phospholipase D-like domain-containing protein [Arenibacter certesii]|uniref:Phospholipase D-like domain-containing protein n=1 Tax=Arenibacter certesii TaxID=228955 RepID=A0A918MS56_9FLAO|nr:phospholipase D-like domain-containing protein [Arenibacter certesii]GGW51062.1 hypothetical protein GCM10007383_38290 [Arenibacter certesii]